MKDYDSVTPNLKVISLKPPCVCRSDIVIDYSEDLSGPGKMYCPQMIPESCRIENEVPQKVRPGRS